MQDPVYLDNAATTPLDPRVLEAMLPHLGADRGNPSSCTPAARPRARPSRRPAPRSPASSAPRRGRSSLPPAARRPTAWPSSALARAAGPERRHLVVSRVEHAAVREAARRLESEGFEVTWLGVDGHGLVDAEEFAAALRPDTALAAVMWANNEVGTVQPVEELAAECARRGVPFHADAVQAAGREPIDVGEVAVSTLAVSGHKLYGPQGVGALYVREGPPIAPILFGGGQEGGLRSGTENVAGLVGLGGRRGLAPRRAGGADRPRDRPCATGLIESLLAMPDVELNGHPERRLSNNVHVSVRGVGAESLVLVLDALGYAIGSGSACSSGGAQGPRGCCSRMGRDEQEASLGGQDHGRQRQHRRGDRGLPRGVRRRPSSACARSRRCTRISFQAAGSAFST